ncbi:MAG: ATP-binding protein [Planctomycetota bacterium]
MSNRREEIDRAQRCLLEAMAERGFDGSSRFAVRLAVEEALSNAIQHGNRNDPAKTVKLEFVVEPSSVLIDVMDQGEGFDPGTVPDPTRRENVDIPSGRGIVLMRSFMSEVEFHPPGNRVRMRYELRRGTKGLRD